MSVNYQNITKPLKIGNKTLKNRMGKSPQASFFYTEDHYYDRRLVDMYTGMSKGGAAMLILGGILWTVGHKEDQFYGALFDDKWIPQWQDFTNKIHEDDCVVIAQLHHGGPVDPVFENGPIASSSWDPAKDPDIGRDYLLPTRGVTLDEIEFLKDQYINSAYRAKLSGFDGVEVHSANGYFLASFLTRIWNRRDDQYGCQNMENRTRLQREIIEGIRAKCGEDFIIGVRINGQEFGNPRANTREEGIEAAKWLEKAGVDYINVTAYGYDDTGKTNPGMQYVPDYWAYPEPDESMKPYLKDFHSGLIVPIAAGIKQNVNVPVLVAGRIDEKRGDEVIEKGMADFILLGRQMWADHEFAKKVCEGRIDDIVRCNRCATCEDTAAGMRGARRCRVNPALGHPEALMTDLKPAEKKKKVMVVGAGPSGMEAARVLKLRGHDVTLYDKAAKLGGKLHLATMIKGTYFEDVPSIPAYLSTQLQKLNVPIKLGVKVDAALIEKEKPDAVVLAVGGKYSLPTNIPGLSDKTVDGVESLSHMAELPLRIFGAPFLSKATEIMFPIGGSHIVIIGGQIEALQGAAFMAKRGKKVTVLEESDTTGLRIPPRYLRRMYPWFEKHNVEIKTGVTFKNVTKKSVTIVNKEGKEETINCSSVHVYQSPGPNVELKKQIEGKVPEIYTVGCANGTDSSLMINALYEGRMAGLSI